jgi:two-component system, LytTR family, response regulator
MALVSVLILGSKKTYPNMRWKALLADDELHAVENLRRLIDKHCSCIQVSGIAYDTDEIKTQVSSLQPDILFLDIKMPGGYTLEVIDAAVARHTVVVFVSAFEEFALRAIKFGAFDYLLKPVDPNELIKTVARVEERLLQKKHTGTQRSDMPSGTTANSPASLGIYTSNEYHVLLHDDIIAFEAVGAYTRIHTRDQREYLTSKNIGHYEDLLSGKGFYRVHKSFIINTSNVSAVNRNQRLVKMMNEQHFPVSMRLMAGFMSHISH